MKSSTNPKSTSTTVSDKVALLTQAAQRRREIARGKRPPVLLPAHEPLFAHLVERATRPTWSAIHD